MSRSDGGEPGAWQVLYPLLVSLGLALAGGLLLSAILTWNGLISASATYLKLANFFVVAVAIQGVLLLQSRQGVFRSAWAFFSRSVALRSSVAVLSTIAAAVLGGVLISFLVLRGFPNSADEFGYLFASETLRNGRLWNSLHPLQDFFHFFYLFEREGKWVSQYAPGWPSVLAAGYWLGIPLQIVGSLLGGLTLALVFFTAKRRLGLPVSLLVVLAVAVTPFFLFNAASYHSHVLAAAGLAGAAYCGSAFLKEPRFIAGLGLGICIGVVGITRYYDAMLASLAFAAFFFAQPSRQRLLQSFAVVLGGLPFLLALLAYNYQITGHPLVTVTSWGLPAMGIGFDAVGIGGPHSIQKAVLNTSYWLNGISTWASFVVFPLYLFAVLYLFRAGRLEFYDLYLLIFALGFVLFPDRGGNSYGARYYFAAFPCSIVTIGAALELALTRGDMKLFGRLAPGLVAFHFLSALAALPLFIALEGRVVWERMDLYRLVEERGLDNAIVFVGSGTGFSRYMPWNDLTRNSIDLDGPVLYARDRGELNAQLVAYYPQRSAWRYVRAQNDPRGRLVPIRQ